jgi:hypothetical protein
MDSVPHDSQFDAPGVEELQPLFPGYEVSLFVAQGGMGAVYKAHQVSLDRPVAIKILPRQFGEDPQFRESFQAEARAMARLNHPNLIAVYDFGAIDGMLYIIMEYVEGKSLFHSAHGKTVEQVEAARLAAGICQGLAHAHQHQILHRDIKPANILLTAHAEPKIGDFGLARPVGHHEGEETIFGTPGYTAPEVLNHPERVDQRADLYSTGVILYELLTGHLPGESWQPPSAVAKVDPAFDPIVRRAMHPSPEMRYADAKEMAEHLESLAARLKGPLVRKGPAAGAAAAPSAAPRAMPGTRPARPVLSSAKSASFPAWAGVLIVVLLVVGIVGFIAASSGGGDAPPQSGGATPAAGPPETPAAAKEPARQRPEPKPGQRPAIRDETRKRERDMPAVARKEPEPKGPGPQAKPPAKPEPKPEPKVSTFDHVAFLDKGRTKLMQTAQPHFAAHTEEIGKSVDRFERDLKRVARRLNNNQRDAGEALVEEVIGTVRETNRVPPKPPDVIPKYMDGIASDVREAFAEAAEDQAGIDAELDEQIAPLHDLYLSGISKQIETLRKAGDEIAVAALEEESAKTLDSMPRFIRILKGEDPDPPGAETGDVEADFEEWLGSIKFDRADGTFWAVNGNKVMVIGANGKPARPYDAIIDSKSRTVSWIREGKTAKLVVAQDRKSADWFFPGGKTTLAVSPRD